MMVCISLPWDLGTVRRMQPCNMAHCQELVGLLQCCRLSCDGGLINYIKLYQLYINYIKSVVFLLTPMSLLSDWSPGNCIFTSIFDLMLSSQIYLLFKHKTNTEALSKKMVFGYHLFLLSKFFRFPCPHILQPAQTHFSQWWGHLGMALTGLHSRKRSSLGKGMTSAVICRGGKAVWLGSKIG